MHMYLLNLEDDCEMKQQTVSGKLNLINSHAVDVRLYTK